MSKVVNNEIQTNSLADNKIQAKTPEVGDVWKIKGKDTLFHIEAVEGAFVTVLQMIISPIVFERVVDKELLEKHCEYLGKSKANISDLFKMENE